MIWVGEKKALIEVDCFEGFEYEFIYDLGIELNTMMNCVCLFKDRCQPIHPISNSFESVLQLQNALMLKPEALQGLYPKFDFNLYKHIYGTKLN